MLDGNCEKCMLRSTQDVPGCLLFERVIDTDVKGMCRESGHKHWDNVRDGYLGGLRAIHQVGALDAFLAEHWGKQCPEGSPVEVVRDLLLSLKETNADLRGQQKVQNDRVQQLMKFIEELKEAGLWKKKDQTAGYINGIIYATYAMQGKTGDDEFVEAPGDQATVAPEQEDTSVAAEPGPDASINPVQAKIPGEVRLSYEGPIDPIGEWLTRVIGGKKHGE